MFFIFVAKALRSRSSNNPRGLGMISIRSSLMYRFSLRFLWDSLGYSQQRNTYLSNWYWKLKQRKGANKRAIIALGRKLLVMIYTMLKHGSVYDENCFELRRKHLERKRVSRMLSELHRLGYRLSHPIAQQTGFVRYSHDNDRTACACPSLLCPWCPTRASFCWLMKSSN